MCRRPDFAGGGQIITPAADLQHIYECGKGSVRVRARYEIKSWRAASGVWWWVNCRPIPGAQKILAEIEEQTNPKPKAGGSSSTRSAQHQKADA